jgi:hypothetical protein
VNRADSDALFMTRKISIYNAGFFDNSQNSCGLDEIRNFRK